MLPGSSRMLDFHELLSNFPCTRGAGTVDNSTWDSHDLKGSETPLQSGFEPRAKAQMCAAPLGHGEPHGQDGFPLGLQLRGGHLKAGAGQVTCWGSLPICPGKGLPGESLQVERVSVHVRFEGQDPRIGSPRAQDPSGCYRGAFWPRQEWEQAGFKAGPEDALDRGTGRRGLSRAGSSLRGQAPGSLLPTPGSRGGGGEGDGTLRTRQGPELLTSGS